MKRATILVVDNCAAVRKTLRRTLESVGYSVIAAASGEEALGVLRAQQVDAVILDLHMPVMSGQTLFHVIIGTWPALKARVLIMTEDKRAEENETWLRLYDLPVLKKPFALSEVIILIEVLAANEPLEANGS